jgi:hypothetical protein
VGYRASLAALALVAVGVVATAAPAKDVSDPVERGCRFSVYGGLGDWQQRSVAVGPIGFVGAPFYAEGFTPDDVGGGRFRPSKLLVVLKTGWVARVSVPAAQRATLALAYDVRTFNNPVAPVDGDHVVNFRACAPGKPFVGPRTQRWTQFNGAIVVAEPQCVTLNLAAAKQGHPLRGYKRVRFGFGVAC